MIILRILRSRISTVSKKPYQPNNERLLIRARTLVNRMYTLPITGTTHKPKRAEPPEIMAKMNWTATPATHSLIANLPSSKRKMERGSMLQESTVTPFLKKQLILTALNIEETDTIQSVISAMA